MTDTTRNILYFGFIALLIIATGFVQSWNSALFVLNSAIMALGVNLQWGFAGLFNVGIVGFVALGGLAAVLVSMPPVGEAWAAGGIRVILALILGASIIVGAILAYGALPKGRARAIGMIAILFIGFFVYRAVFDGGVQAIEAVNPANAGYLGGLGLPVLLAWPVGGLLAAGAAWIIGKTALGLRLDYLAIATLGIAEIIIAVLKNEGWLARGVKNVVGLPLTRSTSKTTRPLSNGSATSALTRSRRPPSMGQADLCRPVCRGADRAVPARSTRAALALGPHDARHPRQRGSRRSHGQDVTARHLQVFVLGSAICGIAGAMMTTLDGQLTPGTYHPLRFTFLVWVMVIVGGSGNNLGSVLGGFLIWWLWVMVEPIGLGLMQLITAGMADGYWLREHLLDSAAHMRLFTMGLVLLLVLRFSPRGLIPEK